MGRLGLVRLAWVAGYMGRSRRSELCALSVGGGGGEGEVEREQENGFT